MSPTGSGPKIMLVALPFLAGAIVAQVWWPQAVRLTAEPSRLLPMLGVALLGLGLGFWAWSVVTFVREFPAGRLITTGPFALCRHPIYASVSLFVLPGVALLANSWAFFVAAVVMSAASAWFSREEDAELERTFGPEYRLYRARVPAFFPVPQPRPRGPKRPLQA
jgi:protein-S-isoprenylcysteine O-methyltransferase Ste14